MLRQPSILVLQQAVLRRTLHDGRETHHPESSYLDFVVDGQSLLQRQTVSNDLLTPLNRAWLHMVPEAIDQLWGRHPAPDLAAGRIALLVCGDCGDLRCGAITASLSVTPERVSWTDFCWENGFDPPSPVDLAADRGFAFERHAYDTAMSQAYDRTAALPHDEAAHQARKLPWPWRLRLPPKR